jgi:hypothetical protein
MKRPEEIKINRFQLKVLLNDNQKEGFDYIVNHNVYCGNTTAIHISKSLKRAKAQTKTCQVV